MLYMVCTGCGMYLDVLPAFCKFYFIAKKKDSTFCDLLCILFFSHRIRFANFRVKRKYFVALGLSKIQNFLTQQDDEFFYTIHQNLNLAA
jgi:hypothetical protein